MSRGRADPGCAASQPGTGQVAPGQYPQAPGHPSGAAAGAGDGEGWGPPRRERTQQAAQGPGGQGPEEATQAPGTAAECRCHENLFRAWSLFSLCPLPGWPQKPQGSGSFHRHQGTLRGLVLRFVWVWASPAKAQEASEGSLCLHLTAWPLPATPSVASPKVARGQRRGLPDPGKPLPIIPVLAAWGATS